MLLRNLPGDESHKLVKLSNSLDLRIHLVKAEQEPFKRSTCKQELVLQDVHQVLALVAANSHDCKVVVHVLREQIVLRLAHQFLRSAFVVVHDKDLGLHEHFHVLGKPGHQSVVLVDSTIDEEYPSHELLEIDSLAGQELVW